jgi:hypothetical protein
MTELLGQPYEVDHRIPIIRQGPHAPSNLQVLSLTENRRKGDNLV